MNIQSIKFEINSNKINYIFLNYILCLEKNIYLKCLKVMKGCEKNEIIISFCLAPCVPDRNVLRSFSCVKKPGDILYISFDLS